MGFVVFRVFLGSFVSFVYGRISAALECAKVPFKEVFNKSTRRVADWSGTAPADGFPHSATLVKALHATYLSQRFLPSRCAWLLSQPSSVKSRFVPLLETPKHLLERILTKFNVHKLKRYVMNV